MPRLAILVLLCLAQPVVAAEWGVGAAAGTRPVLSMAVSPSRDATYHATMHLSDERVVITTDVQRHVTPPFGYGRGWHMTFYGGVGAEGMSERQGDVAETWNVRMPLGAQCNVTAASLAVFIEGAATVGPLPKMSLSGVGLAGLRAVF